MPLDDDLAAKMAPRTSSPLRTAAMALALAVAGFAGAAYGDIASANSVSAIR